MVPFLQAANHIDGLLVAILMDKRLPSLFTEEPLPPSDPELIEFAGWKPKAVERALRSIHFVSLLLRGLSASRQDVMWILDQDSVVANERRLRLFVNIFGRVSSHYLPHDLGHLRIGTTAGDPGTREVEDLTAIADLAAGALADTVPDFFSRGGALAKNIIVPPSSDLKTKAGTLLDWYSDNSQPLRRFTSVLSAGVDRTATTVSSIRFHASSDL